MSFKESVRYILKTEEIKLSILITLCCIFITGLSFIRLTQMRHELRMYKKCYRTVAFGFISKQMPNLSTEQKDGLREALQVARPYISLEEKDSTIDFGFALGQDGTWEVVAR